MGKRLTSLAVEKLKPQARRAEVPDGLVTGLYLLVQPSGTKSWALRYRHNGKPRKLTIGRYPGIGLSGARDIARAELLKVAMGEDPAVAKQEAKHRPDKGPDTVEALTELFIDRHAKRHTRSWAATEKLFARHILPKWGERPIESLQRRDMVDLLESINARGTGVMANRVLFAFRKFCNWCIERDALEVSPCVGVKPVVAETSRDRVLSDDEIRWLWKACDGYGYPFGPLVQLLLLTGQRRDEIGGIVKSEIDWQSGVWTLPGARAKNAREHVVPLSAPALDILKALPHIQSGAGYLFTTNGENKVSGFSRARNRLRHDLAQFASAEIAAKSSHSAAVDHWTFHDLRRTAASGIASLGQPVHIVEAVLNHKSGTIRGVTAVYNRHSYLNEKRTALELWGHYVMGLVGHETDRNVVSLRP